jgi:tetratricopeptide (TPR) repeat protein
MVLVSYWNAVAAGLSKAAAGETLAYRDGKVTIVSVGEGTLKLKAENGAEKSFDTDRDKIDLDVAHAVAQDRLDDMGPVGLAAIGAAKAMDRQTDLAQARELWKKALENGIPVSHFVAESKYDFSKLVADTIAVPPAGARKPKPSQGDRAAAAKKVRKLFGAPIRLIRTADQAQQARDRAIKMLDQAEDRDNPDPIRYELFEEGINQLILVGALEEARGAIDELAKTFEVDHVDRTAGVMKSMANIVVNPDAAKMLIEEIKTFAYEAALLGKIETATDLIGPAKKLASKLENKKRNKPLTKNLARFSKFFGNLKKLVKNADDPAAHLFVGEFQCYTMDDWDRGLKHLAKVSDKQLSELARDDLASPKDNEAQLALGDRWWNIHEETPAKSQLIERVAIGRRAKHWYEASPGLGKGTGIITREKKLKTLAQEMEQLDIIPAEGLNLLASWKAETGVWAPRDGALITPWTRKVYPRIMFPVMPVPTGAYQLDIEFERLPGKGAGDIAGALFVCLPLPGRSYCALTVSSSITEYNGVVVTPGAAGKRLGGKKYKPRLGKRHTLTVWVTPGAGGTAVKIEAKVDGVVTTSWAGPIAQLKRPISTYRTTNPRTLGIGVVGGGMKIYKAQFQGSRSRN